MITRTLPPPRRQAAVFVAVAALLSAPSQLHAVPRTNSTIERQQNEEDPTVRFANGEFAGAVSQVRITRRFEIYNPQSSAQLRQIKELGFTQVILDRAQLYNEAAAIGLDVVLANWWTAETPDHEIEQGLERARSVDPRRLVAVSMMDEPERYAPQTPFSFYQALYYDLRAQLDKDLPNVKLEVSHWGPLASWTDKQYQQFVPLYQATDRIRLMPYPDLREGELNEVYYQMLRSRRLMKMAGVELPQVVILQTWELPENPKLPTIDELRVMAYTALLTGADTLSFYNYDPEVWKRTPGFTRQFAVLMRELTAFSKAYRQAAVETRMSPSGVLTASVTPAAGRGFSVRVNANRSARDGLDALTVIFEHSLPAATVRPPVACRRTVRSRMFRWRRCWK